MKKCILPVIDSIYSAALDPNEWERSAYLIKDYVGGHTVNMLVHNLENYNVNFSFTTALGDQEAAYYFENILPYDDINAIYDKIKPSAFLTSDVFTDDEITRTFAWDNFYKDFGMDRFDAVLIDQTDSHRAFMSVVRSKNDIEFTAQDKLRLQELLPHLQRSLEINRRLSEQQVLASFSIETLNHLTTPVFLLDANGNIIVRNTEAEVAECAGFYCVKGKKIHLEDKDAIADLIRLLGSRFATSVVNNTVSFTHNEKRGVMLCCPLNPSKYVVDGTMWAVFLLREVTDFNIPSDWLQSMYDLSKTETKVLELLLRGLKTSAIANQLGVSRDGVKFHLKNLSHKTNTNGQVELVLKLAKSFSQVVQ